MFFVCEQLYVKVIFSIFKKAITKLDTQGKLQKLGKKPWRIDKVRNPRFQKIANMHALTTSGGLIDRTTNKQTVLEQL